MNDDVVIFCPDCRGKFEESREDIIEGELIECPLCAAEIKVVQEDPIRIRLFHGDDDF